MTYDQRYFSGDRSGYVFSYDVMRVPFLWRAEKRHISHFVCGGDILDIGCAYGHFLNTLPSSFDTYGVDVSKHAIKRAHALYGDTMHFELGDIKHQAPFNKKQFDLVTSFNVFEHFSNPCKVIAAAARSVKPGGYLYTRFPFKDPYFCRDQYHYYQSATNWLKDFNAHFDIIQTWYYFTLWGKLSDIRAPSQLANFLAVMLRKKR